MTAGAAVAAGPAHRIASDDEAIDVARRLRARLAEGAAERDAERRLPHEEVRELAASGLLGAAVPRAYGGAGVAPRTLAGIYRHLAAGDPNVAQIPQSHAVFLHLVELRGTEEQRRLLFGEVLDGALLGNAQAEAGAATPGEIATAIVREDDGLLHLRGRKQYSTGALFADRIPVTARDADGLRYVAYVPRDHPGIAVVDDWDGMGQRTTASGTVVIDDAVVPEAWVIPLSPVFEEPGVHGALAQLLHAAIDAGIAEGALADGVDFLRTRGRPWIDAGVDRADEDPLTLQRVGELTVRVRAAEALLDRAARAIARARADLTAETAADASIEVAGAKALAGEVAVEVTSAIFDLCGTRSAGRTLNLHRHWRNARTHTLHDPVRWKLQHIGRHVVHGTHPPRHSAI